MSGKTVLLVGAMLALAAGVATFTRASTAAGVSVPTNQSPPAIQGTTQEGSVLKADHGQWNSHSTVAYSHQWRRCLTDGTGCLDVPKATDQIYPARGDDVGHSLRVVVTATNKDGPSSVTSPATATVTALPAQAPHNTALPVISGSATPGQLLTAASGTWTGATPIAFSYRWRRCNATGGDCKDTLVQGRTYKLSSGDANHALRIAALIRGGSRPAAARREIDDAEPPLRLQRLRDIHQELHDLLRVRRLVHLVKRVGDDYGIDARRQPRIGRRAEDRTNVEQVLTLHALADRFEHLSLHVFGIDDAVGPDATREPQGEPAAGGAQFGGRRSVRNAEAVHDQLGLVPLRAIGSLEEPQILRVEQLALRFLLRGLVR